MDDLNTIWQQALKKYEKDARHAAVVQNSMTDVTNPEDLKLLLTAKGVNFDTFRSSHHKLYSMIQKWVQPVAAFALIGKDIGESSGYGPPLTVTCGVIAHLIGASQHVSDTFDFVTTVFSELDEFADRLERYVAVSPMSDALERKIVLILSFFVRIIGKSERIIKQGRLAMFFKSVFLGKDREAKKLVDELNQAIGNEQQLVTAEIYSTSAETREMMSNHNKHVMQQAIDMEDLGRMENAFKTPTIEVCHAQYGRNRQQMFGGSGAWLLQERLFKSWMRADTPILWILGEPGIGKTMLCTWLITHLFEEKQKSSNNPDYNINVAYFYIRQDNTDLQEIGQLLKCLAWQLQEQSPSFKRHLAEVSKTIYKTAAAKDIWKSCFLDYFLSDNAQHERCLLIVDGLDEARPDRRRGVLAVLEEFQRITPNQHQNLQFAIFGRLTLRYDIPLRAFNNEFHYIHITSDKNRQDLKNYIVSHVNSLAVIEAMRRRGRPEDTKKFISYVQRKVFLGADGIFLWAQIILEQIRSRDETGIRKLLEKPPISLDKLILAVLERLSHDGLHLDEDSESATYDASLILIWVSKAQRPLSFGEINAILQLNNRATTWTLWEQLRGKFASILTLRYPPGYDPDKAESSKPDVLDSRDEVEVVDDFLNDDADLENDADLDLDCFSSSPAQSVVTLVEHSEPLERQNSRGSPSYSSNQILTTVEFTHARFRDIIEEQKRLQSNGENVLGVFGENEQSDYLMFIDCLAMLETAADTKDVKDRAIYATYPTLNIFAHLAAIDKENLSTEKQAIIVNGIHWLLNERRGCMAFFSVLCHYNRNHYEAFWSMWYSERRTIDTLQNWLSTAGSLNDKAKDDWIKSATSSTKALLKTLAVTAAECWLVQPDYQDPLYDDDVEFYVWFLKAYISISPDGVVPDEVSNFSFQYISVLDYYPLSSVTVVEVAEWAGFEKDSYFYTRLTLMLWRAGFMEDALKAADKAIDMSITAWRALQLKSYCLASNADDQAACDEILKAYEAVPQELTRVRANCLAFAARCYANLKLIDKQYEYATKAWDLWQNGLTAMEYVTALGAKEEWQELMDVLHNFDREQPTLHSLNLTNFFVQNGFPSWLGPAVHSVGKEDWLMQALEAALKDRDSAHDSIEYACQLAIFQIEWCDEEERGLKLLDETVLQVREVPQGMRVKVKFWMESFVGRCAQLWFDRAVKNHRGGERNNLAAKKLEALATTTTISEAEEGTEVFTMYSLEYPSQLWGRWLRDYKKVEDQTWKKSFQRRILRLVGELDDKDPTNDTRACAMLATTLFQAGDRKAASELLAALYQPLAARRKGSVAEAESEKIQCNKEESQDDGGRMTSAALDTSKQDKVVTQVTPTEISVDTSPENREELDTDYILVDSMSRQSLKDTQILAAGDLVPKRVNSIPITSDAFQNDPLGETQSELRLELGLGAPFTCDACRDHDETTDEMWFCEICYDTNFCGNCLKQVKDGTVKRKICNAEHDFYRAWPIPDGLFKEVAHSYADGAVILRKEWLDGMRNKWL